MADSANATTLDILPDRSGPPLSATSDMPVVKAAEVVQPEIKTAESDTLRAEPPIKVEAKADEPIIEPVKTAEELAADAEAAKKVKADAGIEREIVKERNKARAERAARETAEAAADKLSTDLSKALEAIEKLTSKPAEPTADPRPTRDKFETPDAYDEALVSWSARQATELATREAEAKHLEDQNTKEAERVQQEQAAEQTRVAAEWTARREKAVEKYSDYAEVAESDDLQISIPMSFAILNAGDLGPDLAYHLGKNPEEAARIAGYTISDGKGGQMPNAPMQVFELGKLAAGLNKPKPVSRAPDPITTIGARERAAEKPAEEQSMDEYAARSDVKARLASDRRSGSYAN